MDTTVISLLQRGQRDIMRLADVPEDTQLAVTGLGARARQLT